MTRGTKYKYSFIGYFCKLISQDLFKGICFDIYLKLIFLYVDGMH